MAFFQYVINICIFLPILLGLFLLVTRLSNNQYMNLSGKKYVKILEKTPISKDVYSLVMKIGDTVYVGISSPSGFSVIKELSRLEAISVEEKYFNEPMFKGKVNNQNVINNFSKTNNVSQNNSFISTREFASNIISQFTNKKSKQNTSFTNSLNSQKKSDSSEFSLEGFIEFSKSLLEEVLIRVSGVLRVVFEKINRVIKEK